MIKKLLSFFERKKNAFPSYFSLIANTIIYIFLFLVVYSYIITEDIFIFIVLAFSSGILYYYLSNLIKYSENKYISFLQDFILIFFIMLIFTFFYILFISIDYLNFIWYNS
jgi:hypothetical protein